MQVVGTKVSPRFDTGVLDVTYEFDIEIMPGSRMTVTLPIPVTDAEAFLRKIRDGLEQYYAGDWERHIQRQAAK